MTSKNIKIVYVTGACGFIGSYVTAECLKQGWYVIGVDKMTYAASPESLTEFKQYSNFKFIQSDINDLKFLYDCDYIINCAAETHVGNSISNSDEFVTSNINGVHNLLQLIKEYRAESQKTPTLIHFSTDEVYGDITEGAHLETDILKPSNPYSATKAAADMLIQAWNRTYDIPYVIVRPTNNYGKWQYVEKLIPKACKYLYLGRKIPLHNNGTPYRTWLHASDTANAIIKIIESDKTNEIYNISGGCEIQNINVCRTIIEEYTGYYDDTYFDFTCVRPGQDVRYSLDDAKLRELGWKPKTDFYKEIKNIVQFYKNKFIW